MYKEDLALKSLQHTIDNIDQRSTQHWIYKCLDLDKMSKVISMLLD